MLAARTAASDAGEAKEGARAAEAERQLAGVRAELAALQARAPCRCSFSTVRAQEDANDWDEPSRFGLLFLPGAVRQARLSEAERVRGHAEEAFRPGALDALKERGAPNI